jgi:CHAT domain-containing protein
LVARAFEIAQDIGRSRAAVAFAQLNARTAKENGPLASLVRQRQDLVEQWRTDDAKFVRFKTTDFPDNNDRVYPFIDDAVERHIREIDLRLEAEYPDYFLLSRQKSASLEAVQARLDAKSALVFAVETTTEETQEEFIVWVVTRTAARWNRIVAKNDGFSRRIQKLRCGLDESAWRPELNSLCETLTGRKITSAAQIAPRPLPFDVLEAFEIYRILLGPFDDLIANKELLIVPCGPLSTLPVGLLVVEEPAAPGLSSLEGFRGIPWLIKRQTATVLPAVSSLLMPRRTIALAKGTQSAVSRRPYIGFGNPLLDGDPADVRNAWRVAAARRKTYCAPNASPREAKNQAERVAVSTNLADGFFKGATADLTLVRQLLPLPESAGEICEVAKIMGVANQDVFLADRATEQAVKALSMQGALQGYDIVHFSTHALLASETAKFDKSVAESALVLTPPDVPTESNDGLLMVSEISQLTLDADWVVLSACNTAAGDGRGAESLSGLARALFYAGARAILVSHWYVDAEVSRRLVVASVQNKKALPGISYAEALRQAIMTLLQSPEPEANHPSFWAPFVVVGEG